MMSKSTHCPQCLWRSLRLRISCRAACLPWASLTAPITSTALMRQGASRPHSLILQFMSFFSGAASLKWSQTVSASGSSVAAFLERATPLGISLWVAYNRLAHLILSCDLCNALAAAKTSTSTETCSLTVCSCGPSARSGYVRSACTLASLTIHFRRRFRAAHWLIFHAPSCHSYPGTFKSATQVCCPYVPVCLSVIEYYRTVSTGPEAQVVLLTMRATNEELEFVEKLSS